MKIPLDRILNSILNIHPEGEIEEDGFWKTISDYPGHIAGKKEKRKKGDMSFIRDIDSREKFKEKMNLKLREM